VVTCAGAGGREPPLHACTWRWRGRRGEGRGSFITFNAERSKKTAFPIYAFTANFFLIIIRATNIIYAILYVHIYISQAVKKS